MSAARVARRNFRPFPGQHGVRTEEPTDSRTSIARHLVGMPYSRYHTAQVARRSDGSEVRMSTSKFELNKKNPSGDSGTILVPAVPAARLLGLPYSTLRDVAQRGEIPVVLVGRSWYYRRADLLRWVSSRAEVLR
jgi:excisionase family DNA binding protein